MFKNLSKTIESLIKIEVSDERKEVLKPLIDYIQTKVLDKSEIRLNFICTHNSRRSHLAQIWAQTMAFRFGIQNISCYSGGTEATALFAKVTETIENHGFTIKKLSSDVNAIYAIKFDENQPSIIGFSKTYFDEFNPKKEFAAVMTCSQADTGCPFVFGTEKRITITYNDPKAFDNSTQQSKKYAERSLQIASEMFYVFSQIKK